MPQKAGIIKLRFCKTIRSETSGKTEKQLLVTYKKQSTVTIIPIGWVMMEKLSPLKKMWYKVEIVSKNKSGSTGVFNVIPKDPRGIFIEKGSIKEVK